MTWHAAHTVGPLWDNCGRYVVADGAAGARSVGLGAFKSLAEVPLRKLLALTVAAASEQWRSGGVVIVGSAARLHGLLYLEAVAGNCGCAAAGDWW